MIFMASFSTLDGWPLAQVLFCWYGALPYSEETDRLAALAVDDSAGCGYSVNPPWIGPERAEKGGPERQVKENGVSYSIHDPWRPSPAHKHKASIRLSKEQPKAPGPQKPTAER
jgi:hypothetical protein